jgi:hypothetical protein
MDGSITALAFAALVSLAPLAGAQVYKCQDAAGRTTYADAPCGNSGKRVAVPESAPRGLADATVCTQLLDEMRRLAAEDARRAAAKNASNDRRRQALVAQYERRCAAIRRSSR